MIPSTEYERLYDRPATGVVHVGRPCESLHADLLTAYFRLRNCTARSLLLIDEVCCPGDKKTLQLTQDLVR